MSIGIVGAGQLARMLIFAGTRMGLHFRVYDPSPEACAAQLAPLTCGAFADATALLAFARDLDVLTFDFENVPAATLQALQSVVRIAPNPQVLAISQDRLSEKQAFSALGIPVAPYRAVASESELEQAMQELGPPGILKTRTLGYDGKGQARVRARETALAAWQELGQTPCVFESMVPFERELSLIATRSASGEFCAYPLVQNIHEDGILAVSIAPAPDFESFNRLAQDYGRRVAEHFGYVGTFALEFFALGQTLVLNEMAPRVHNSGHLTIEAAECSQFENHVRAIAGLPLGSTALRGPAVMLNWVGQLPDRQAQLETPGLAWHNYGKSPRAGRKIGHSTICAASFEDLRKRLEDLQQRNPTRAGELALTALNAPMFA